ACISACRSALLQQLVGTTLGGTATFVWSLTTLRSHPILAKTELNHSEPVPDGSGTEPAATEPVSTSISTLARRKNRDTQRMLTVPPSAPLSSTRPLKAGPGGNRIGKRRGARSKTSVRLGLAGKLPWNEPGAGWV